MHQHSRHRILITAFALAAILAHNAAAQEPGCQSGWQEPMRLAGVFNADHMIAWDPDGEGPMPEWLVFGGYGLIAGNGYRGAAAAWDGANWHALGDQSIMGIKSFAIHNGSLVALGAKWLVQGERRQV